MKSVITINDKITSTNIGLLLTLIIEGNAKFQVRGSKNKNIYNFFTANIIDPQILCMDAWGFIDPKIRSPILHHFGGHLGVSATDSKCLSREMISNLNS